MKHLFLKYWGHWWVIRTSKYAECLIHHICCAEHPNDPTASWCPRYTRVSKTMDQLLEWLLNIKPKNRHEHKVIGKVGAITAQVQKRTARWPGLCKMENKSRSRFCQVVCGLGYTAHNFFRKCDGPQSCQVYSYKFSLFIRHTLDCCHAKQGFHMSVIKVVTHITTYHDWEIQGVWSNISCNKGEQMSVKLDIQVVMVLRLTGPLKN